MTLMDGFVVIAIFIGFGFLILTQLRKKNPNLTEEIKNWFREKPQIPITENTQGKMQQIYPEKRWGM